MQILGIIGPVASGKTTLANVLQKQLKARVFNADKFVHQLYESSLSVVHAVSLIVPESLVAAKLISLDSQKTKLIIDRKILLNHILKDSSILPKIEAIVHPLVIKELKTFVKSALRNNIALLILDIPLLYKIKADQFCHIILEVKVNNIILGQRLTKRYGNINSFLPILLPAEAALKAIRKLTYSKKVIQINSGLEKRNLYLQALKALSSDHET